MSPLQSELDCSVRLAVGGLAWMWQYVQLYHFTVLKLLNIKYLKPPPPHYLTLGLKILSVWNVLDVGALTGVRVLIRKNTVFVVYSTYFFSY